MAGGRQYETDIAIVGAGGAGVAAGIEARDAGARVIAFENGSEPGGAAIISGGGCLIVGSPLQKANGIHDTPDLAFKDWIAWGGPSADAVWARYYIEHTLHDLYHWAEGLGVKWVDLKVQEGNSVLRWTRAERNGLGLMTRLIEGFRNKGGEIVPETEITGLSLDDGRVAGLEARDTRTGEPVAVKAKAVVVATGGFNSNLDMVLEFNPALRNHKVLEGSGRGSTGSGHRLVRQAGGYLTHMDHIWFYVYATPDYRDPAQRRGLVFRLVPGNIWVNQQGRRFHNEALSGGNSASPALMAQSPRHAWAIMDTPMTATMEIADPYYRDGDKVVRAKVVELLDNSPFIRKAGTLAELAGRMDVDVPAFLATRRALQQGLRAGARDGAGVRQAAQIVEGVRHAALLCRPDLPAGAQELRRRQDRSAVPRARQALRADRRALCRGRGRRHGRRSHQRARRPRRHHAGAGNLQRARRRRLGRPGGRPRPRLRRQAKPGLNWGRSPVDGISVPPGRFGAVRRGDVRCHDQCG